MPGQTGRGHDSNIVSSCSEKSLEERSSIIQPPLEAAICDAINTELRAVRVSQAELERQLREWMSKHGDVLSEVKLQHQKLQTMIAEMAGSRYKASPASTATPALQKRQYETEAVKPQLDGPASASVAKVSETEPHSELRDTAAPDSEKAQLATAFSPYGRVMDRSNDDSSFHVELDKLASMRAKINRQGRTENHSKLHRALTKDITICRKAAQHVVESLTFDVCFGCLIIANAALIGAEVEYNTKKDESHAIFVAGQYFFCIMFIGECAIRVAAAGLRGHFFGSEWLWSWFDFNMVLVSIVEVIDSLSAMDTKDGDDIGSQMLRIVRMARLARIVRVLRFSPQLMVMVFMIIESAKALVYALVLLTIILYVFSICFTMGATDYLKDAEGSRQYADEVQKHYGSIFSSIYTLFKSVTNGQAWGELLTPIFDMGPFYSSVFLFWISFAVLAVLNIVTGFFVDGALAKSALERDLMAEKELSRKRAVVHTLKQLFLESDTDHTGTIEQNEFVEHLKDDRVSAYLAALKIDTSHLKDLFVEIDTDGSGSIDMDEFVENMQHVMGASGLDQNVQRLIMENKEATERWRAFVADVKEGFSEIHDLILTLPDRSRRSDFNVGPRLSKNLASGLIEDKLHMLENVPSSRSNSRSVPHPQGLATSPNWWV